MWKIVVKMHIVAQVVHFSILHGGHSWNLRYLIFCGCLNLRISRYLKQSVKKMWLTDSSEIIGRAVDSTKVSVIYSFILRIIISESLGIESSNNRSLVLESSNRWSTSKYCAFQLPPPQKILPKSIFSETTGMRYCTLLTTVAQFFSQWNLNFQGFLDYFLSDIHLHRLWKRWSTYTVVLGILPVSPYCSVRIMVTYTTRHQSRLSKRLK